MILLIWFFTVIGYIIFIFWKISLFKQYSVLKILNNIHSHYNFIKSLRGGNVLRDYG